MRLRDLAGVLAGAKWKKSGRSNGNGGNNCVEVAVLDTVVAMRDSKDPEGEVHLFTHAQWRAFTSSVKDGTFDQ